MSVEKFVLKLCANINCNCLEKVKEAIVNRIVNITDYVNLFVHKHPMDYSRNGVTFASYNANIETNKSRYFGEDSFSNFV